MRLRFLGATGTVTGSRFLVTAAGGRLLVDCGLFQGYKHLRARNRAAFPVRPASLAAVVLTHAHLDHSGYLPALVRDGFAGRILCTDATRDLCEVLLRDAGKLQEEEAEYANRHRFSKHRPALPLYTLADAEAALERFVAVPFDEEVTVRPGITARLRHAGHILGAATVTLEAEGRTLGFTGDLGRPDDPLLLPPEPIPHADGLVTESTYGDRTHAPGDPGEVIGEIVRRTYARGGTVVIPAFAVGRTQLILYHLHRLKVRGAIPDLKVYLDSPMATDATELFARYGARHRLTPDEVEAVCHTAEVVNGVEASKALDRDRRAKIILSASGMATGGRVVHHIKAFGPDPRSTLLFVGYQAGGTRGADLVHGARSVRIHGADVEIAAEVVQLHEMSAHADAGELVDWLRGFTAPPAHTFIVHGEPDASEALRRRIERTLGWTVRVPEPLERVDV